MTGNQLLQLIDDNAALLSASNHPVDTFEALVKTAA